MGNAASIANLLVVSADVRLVECGTCKACCKSEAVFLQDNEDKDQYPGIELATNPLTGKPGYMLPHKPNGDCSYLGDAGCMIYERRPVMCKAFSCVGLYERVMAQTTRSDRRRSGVMDTDVMKAGAIRAAAAKKERMK